jgi:hypothetical protein
LGWGVTENIAAGSCPTLRGPLGKLARATCSMVEALSRGSRPASHDEITMVIRKPQSHFARLI